MSVPSDACGKWAVEGRCAGKPSFMTRPRYQTYEKAKAFADALGGHRPGPQGWRYVVVELDHEEAPK